VYDQHDCKRAKKKELGGHPEGLIRVVEAADQLGKPPETLYRWEHEMCPLLGRVLKFTRTHGADAGGRHRPTPYMRRGDLDQIREAMSVTNGAALPIEEAAKIYDLSPNVLRDSMRRIHPAVGRLVERQKQYGPTNDTSAARKRKHRRQRRLLSLPIADVEAIARWQSERDGKPHGLTNDQAPVRLSADNGAKAGTAKHAGGRPRKWDHAIAEYRKLRRGAKIGLQKFCAQYERAFPQLPHPTPERLKRALKHRKKSATRAQQGGQN
jgi:hypothetical protein